jgi:hypothetical protein
MINATLTITLPLGSLDTSGGMGGLNQFGGQNPTGQDRSIGSTGSGNGLVDLLADTLIKGLFKKKWDGATFDQNDPLMKLIADFMDKKGSDYARPDDATGSVRNWNDELSEDNYLDKSELAEFTKGLKDALSSILGGGLSQVLGTAGSLISGLGTIAGGLAGGALGGPVGGMVGSSLGGAVGNTVGGTVSGLGNQLGGSNGFGRAGFGGVLPNNTGSGGFNLQDMSPMTQLGFSMGGDFASHVGKTAVDGINIKEDDGRYSFGDEDKDLAKEIGKYMDQHTEEFGKQPRLGWARRIEEGRDFEAAEMDRFKQAMGTIKDFLDGKSSGDKDLDMDTMLVSNSIINEAMHKVAN